MLGALRPQGVVAVNLFGTGLLGGHPRMELPHRSPGSELFAGLDILKFEVYDADGQSFRGPKHWHIFDISPGRT